MSAESQNFLNNGLLISDVIRCVDFAAKKHKDQRRKDPDKTPYINHPIGKIVRQQNNGKFVPVDDGSNHGSYHQTNFHWGKKKCYTIKPALKATSIEGSLALKRQKS